MAEPLKSNKAEKRKANYSWACAKLAELVNNKTYGSITIILEAGLPVSIREEIKHIPPS